ncbi:MAG: BON domain-containing protein [Pyrinomonadaceae bacterium]|nr:BON domain-containing protein [Pyrinomonadaceae bacterium]
MKTKLITVLGLSLALLLGACGGPSDADLQSSADKALKGDTSTSTVTVEVKDGVATITGDVKDDAAKAKAEELAKVEGVKSVTNDVNVVAPVPEAKGDDSEVKAKIEEGLKKAGCATITVEVKDGVATLSGKIDKAQMAKCVQAANTGGAKKVENKINL